jgi:protein-arginine kinase activator protein McsA
MNERELELLAALHEHLRDALRRGQWETAQWYQDETNELLAHARESSN